MPRRRRVRLRGSERSDPERGVAVGKVDRDQPITVTLYLKNPATEEHAAGSAADLASLMRGTTRRSLARHRAAEFAPAAAAIRKFAKKNGLSVRASRLSRRAMVLTGTAASISKPFNASLRMYEEGALHFRARIGHLLLPPDIAPWIRAVLGFDHRPLVRLKSSAGVGDGGGMLPSDVADLYGLPRDNSGQGQCIGVIALGGGYLSSDIAAAVAPTGRPPPVIVDKSVDGATNSFEGGTDADEEIALDLQVLASIVPSAKLVVYFAQNTTASLAAAIHAAVFDDVNRPNILSISWGSAEKFWTESARAAVQAALADAVHLKMTVTAASGDFLATGGLSDQKAHVFFPASSPYVLGCGGSEVTVTGGVITAEIAWKDGSTGTGGGISDTFPVPEYQRALTLPPSTNDGGIRRGVPDVAAAAARLPGYRIFVGGNPVVTDGTSAVAPLWAAIVAIANARMGAPMGFINPALYANGNLFRAIVAGDNRVNSIGYSAGPGWNACTGLGSPHAKDIIDALLQPAVS